MQCSVKKCVDGGGGGAWWRERERLVGDVALCLGLKFWGGRHGRVFEKDNFAEYIYALFVL